jgi:hypothetical protein
MATLLRTSVLLIRGGCKGERSGVEPESSEDIADSDGVFWTCSVIGSATMPFMKITRISTTFLAATFVAAATASTTASTAAAATAPAAAPRAAGSDLDVQITQGSASVAGGTSVKLKGTYTCNDTLGAHDVTIVAVLDQGNANGGHQATVNVPCQVTDGAWSASVLFPGVEAGTEIDAQATVTDTDLQATAQARLISHTAFVSLNPAEKVNANGTVTISGTYGCSDTETGDILATLNKIQTGGAAAVGVAALTASCPATAAPWSATVTLASMPASPTGAIEQSFDVTWGDGHQRILGSGEMLSPQP